VIGDLFLCCGGGETSFSLRVGVSSAPPLSINSFSASASNCRAIRTFSLRSSSNDRAAMTSVDSFFSGDVACSCGVFAGLMSSVIITLSFFLGEILAGVPMMLVSVSDSSPTLMMNLSAGGIGTSPLD
jgi:hypothetical protein